MLRNGTVQRQRAGIPPAAALLYNQFILGCDQKDVDTAVLQAMLVNNGSQFLADYQVGIIDNIEQFVRHTYSNQFTFNSFRASGKIASRPYPLPPYPSGMLCDSSGKRERAEILYCERFPVAI
jgi:hypothetical protein